MKRALALGIAVAAAIATSQVRTATQTVSAFAALSEQLSEPNGDFDTDNLISNESSYLHVMPALEQGGVKVHILSVSPRKKRVGLFKGEIWVDAATYLPVRESGTFVRNPSVFLKKVEFVREYEIRQGLLLPTHIESRIETRLVCRAEVKINFSNFAQGVSEQALVTPASQVQ